MFKSNFLYITITLVLLFNFLDNISAQKILNNPNRFKKDQIIIAEKRSNSTTILPMGQQISQKIQTANFLRTLAITDSAYVLSNRLMKINVELSLMGNTSHFSSDNEESLNSPLGEQIKKYLEDSSKIFINRLKHTSFIENNNIGTENEIFNSSINSLENSEIDLTDLLFVLPDQRYLGKKWSIQDSSKNENERTNYTLTEIDSMRLKIIFDGVKIKNTQSQIQGLDLVSTFNYEYSGFLIYDLIKDAIEKKQYQSKTKVEVIGNNDKQSYQTQESSTTEYHFIDKIDTKE